MSVDTATVTDWVDRGTALVRRCLHQSPGPAPDLSAATALPGWTRRHVVAHLASNADALGNLLRWARTGVPTPMYSSPEQREQDIRQGAVLPDAELLRRFDDSAARLAAATAELDPVAWEAEVVTAQGRTVPASQVPWLRAREVMVHAVDLDAGVSFADLPAPFLRRLVEDVVARRTARDDGPALRLLATDGDASWQLPGPRPPVTVRAPLADLAAYLTGRTPVTGSPQLPAWL